MVSTIVYACINVSFAIKIMSYILNSVVYSTFRLQVSPEKNSLQERGCQYNRKNIFGTPEKNFVIDYETIKSLHIVRTF